MATQTYWLNDLLSGSVQTGSSFWGGLSATFSISNQTNHSLSDWSFSFVSSYSNFDFYNANESAIANADGTNEQLLYQMPRVRSPRWSPDGKYIVFTEDKSKSDNQPIWKLGIVEVATGKLSEPQCTTLCYSPTWGSDSTTIVYTDPAFGVLTTSILGGPATRILGPSGYYWDANFNILRPILGLPQIQGLDSNPDGKRVAYSQQAHDRWELSVMNSDGTYPTGITTADPILSILFDKVVHNTAPIWSPDGKQILFLSDRNGKWEFFVADANGQNIRQVLKNVTDSVTIKFNFENERQMDWVQ